MTRALGTVLAALPIVKVSILVVDDDATTIDILSCLLLLEGYAVEACDSADQALGRVRERAYDVLLTDLVMPEMSGRELIDAARVYRPTMRCVIMSGHADDRAGESDVAWVTKPLDLDQLLTTLRAS